MVYFCLEYNSYVLLVMLSVYIIMTINKIENYSGKKIYVASDIYDIKHDIWPKIILMEEKIQSRSFMHKSCIYYVRHDAFLELYLFKDYFRLCKPALCLTSCPKVDLFELYPTCRCSNELLHVDVKMWPSCLTHSINFDTLYCRQTTKH